MVSIEEVSRQVSQAVSGLLAVAEMKPGQILVVGCSTSEVGGARIGSQGSEQVAQAILDPLMAAVAENKIFLAIQCCEHLNRALIVEAEAAQKYGLEIVSAMPIASAGGSLSAKAFKAFSNPVLVEAIQAHGGIDIGDTFIGMHLRPVVVPVRLELKKVGSAHLTLAKTRPKLIGGARAVYC